MDLQAVIPFLWAVNSISRPWKAIYKPQTYLQSPGHMLPQIFNFNIKKSNSNTNICLHLSGNWTRDNAVWPLWRDPSYAIFKETFWVELMLLRSAGYFGRSIELLSTEDQDAVKLAQKSVAMSSRQNVLQNINNN